jgi:26S proteasome regulatory subunit N2
MVGLTSASGLVGFLSEPDPELRVFALKTLDAEVDVLWTDIVDAIPQMYVLSQILSSPMIDRSPAC